MPSQPGSPLESLLGDVDAETRQALQQNEQAIREHARGDTLVFLGRGTSSDGRNVDRNAFVYLTATVIGIAAGGTVIDGFPRKHITEVRSAEASDGAFAVIIEAAPVDSRYEMRFDDAATRQRFVDALAR